jgi:MEDS: MEthanogen/methylotroph, DcmR Sensory domain
MISSEIVQTLRRMKPGTHTILIYDSPQNKYDVLFTHLGLGVDDSMLAYVCSEESRERVEEEMVRYGINVKALKHNDKLIVANSSEVYVNKEGEFDIPGIIGHLSYLAWDAYMKKSLIGGLRVAEEMSYFFRHDKISELMIYERRLHRTFSFPAMGVCAYNLAEMHDHGHLETLLSLLHAHDQVILTGPKGLSVLEPTEPREKKRERAAEAILQGLGRSR